MTERPFIDALAETWERTAEVCAGLQPGEWELPTDCPGWTVRDQVSHIIGTELLLLGQPSPPPAPAGLAHVKNPIGEINEAWVEERRTRPGPDVLAEFREVTARRVAQLRGMTDEDLAADSPSPIGIVPYATFMDVRVMDCWVHEQDIRRAVGRPGGLDGPAAGTALRRFGASLGFVVGKRAGAPDGVSVVIDVTGPTAATYAVAVRDGRAVAVDPPSDPTVRITTDTEAYACLVTGRWTRARATDAGRVRITGDAGLGAKVVDNLGVIP